MKLIKNNMAYTPTIPHAKYIQHVRLSDISLFISDCEERIENARSGVKKACEEALQEASYLMWLTFYFPKYGGIFHHSPNEAMQSPRKGANAQYQNKMSRGGMQIGFPDILLCRDIGLLKVSFIELKYGKNKPHSIQKELLDYIKAYVCYDLKGVKAIFDKFYDL